MDSPTSAYEKTQPLEACEFISSLNIINPTVPSFLNNERHVQTNRTKVIAHAHIHIHSVSYAASAGAGKLKARFENMAKASDEENRKKAEEEKARRQARESRERELAKRRQEVNTCAARSTCKEVKFNKCSVCSVMVLYFL